MPGAGRWYLAHAPCRSNEWLDASDNCLPIEFALSSRPGPNQPFLRGSTPDMSMFIGEALAGDGNEIAHIDLLIGSKDGPVGVAFANALARQSEGHTNLLAVLTPNLAVKPATVMITKVTIKGMRQAVQMFGPAQAAVAKAIADSVADGVIKKSQAEDLVCVCGVFIHPEAADDRKIYDYNYQATKMAVKNALEGKPTADEMLEGKDKAAHPFRGF
jgi:5,6,7,8-tetrahydromethanopterin hydro-lyase